MYLQEVKYLEWTWPGWSRAFAEGRKKSGTQLTARGLERKGTKRRNITELVGYKESGGDVVREVEFETVMRSAPTISVRCTGTSQWVAATEESPLGRYASRRGPGSGGVGHNGGRRYRLVGRHRDGSMQQSARGGAWLHHEQYAYSVYKQSDFQKNSEL